MNKLQKNVLYLVRHLQFLKPFQDFSRKIVLNGTRKDNHLNLKWGSRRTQPAQSNMPNKTICISVIAFCCAAESKDAPNQQDPFVKVLNESYIIQQACVTAINAASTMLTQITVSIIAAHDEYKKLLENLIKLTQYSENYKGTEVEEELWQYIIAFRASIQEQKKKISELENQLLSIANFINAAAELAFSAKVEYAGIAANERLISAESTIRMSKEEIQRLELSVVEQQKEIAMKTKSEDKSAKELAQNVPSEETSTNEQAESETESKS